jgi:hypothetical protein
MSAEREKMIVALYREHVVPVLRERGFLGSFPHFRRPTAASIHLLTFQLTRMVVASSLRLHRVRQRA